MFFEPFWQAGFTESAVRQVHHFDVGFFFDCCEFPPVLLEENVQHDEGNSLVPVNEWMVLAEMEAVRGGLIEDRLVKELTSDGHLWLG